MRSSSMGEGMHGLTTSITIATKSGSVENLNVGDTCERSHRAKCLLDPSKAHRKVGDGPPYGDNLRAGQRRADIQESFG